jgi:glutamate/tyrosine decarboxylase-like PLP-dependent enzyme
MTSPFRRRRAWFPAGGLGGSATSSSAPTRPPRPPTCLLPPGINVQGLRAASPGLSVIEEIALDWVIQLIGFDPDEVTGGFTTGTTTAHITGLLAARAKLLAERGWDVAADGPFGAPRFKILQYIGFGTNSVCRVPTDHQGRMLVPVLLRRKSAW